eukprot:10575307-Heterocapsa_arctica.AAC.1
MADDVRNKLYKHGSGKEQILYPQTLLSHFSAFPKFAPKCEEYAMAGSIAGKHLMDYVRATRANQSGAIPLIIMAVPDLYHFYKDELANDPFKMNPGIIMGHDKVEVSKVQQVINSSATGAQICIILLDPSADTIQTSYFALRSIGWQEGICVHIMFATHDSCAYESMDILAYVMTNWPGTVIKHLNHIETLIQGIRTTA